MKTEDNLYSKIEMLIIAWNIDGTRTAGSLTREIVELLRTQDEDENKKDEQL
jgi:hypothetical protein